MSSKPLPEYETLFVEAFTQSAIGLALVAVDGSWLEVNPMLCELLGYSQAELLDTSFQRVTHKDDLASDMALVDQVIQRKIPRFTMYKRYIRRDGSILRAQLDVSPVWNAEGKFSFFISQIQDVGARLDAEEALRNAKEEAEQTLRVLSDGVIRIDQNQKVEFINPAMEKILGWSWAEVVGKPIDDLLRLQQADQGPTATSFSLNDIAGSEPDWHRVAVLTLTRGWIPVELSRIEMSGPSAGTVIMLRDLSALHALTNQLHRLATEDPLTDLPNRHSLDRIVRSHFEQRSGQESIYILYVDIDQFKLVNDRFGHRAGDELLAQVAGILLRTSFVSDVCRLGGDEFAIVGRAANRAAVTNTAERFRQGIGRHRFVWNGMPFVVSVSIGISEISSISALDQALSQADAACNLAKAEGRNRVHLYDPDEVSIARYVSDIGWVSEVERAYDDHRLVLFGQKITDIVDGSCHAIEVLVRLKDREGVMVSPGDFIPGLERFGAIERLDKWVIENAVDLFLRHASPDTKVLLFVNISGMSIGSGSFRIWLTQFIERHPGIWGHLVLELTETRAIEHFDAARTLSEALATRDVHIAIDDFGAGFANLVALKGLKAGYVKIDGVLAQQVPLDSVSRAIVSTVCRVVPDLGARVIAEQIEEDEQLVALRALGIRYFQGYLLHRPMPFETIDIFDRVACSS